MILFAAVQSLYTLMSDASRSLSPVNRQDDSYSLDLISGFLDVQLHCLFESVNSDMNLNERIFEKMPSVFGPHVVSECVRYFLVFLNLHLNVCTFHTVPNFVCLFIIVNTLCVVGTVGRLPQFHQCLFSGSRVGTCGPTDISVLSFSCSLRKEKMSSKLNAVSCPPDKEIPGFCRTSSLVCEI